LVASGRSQIAIDPYNTYACERIDHEWKVFEKSVSLDFDHIHALLRLAAGLPHRQHLDYAERITGFHKHQLLDFSTTSSDLDRGEWLKPDIESELAEQGSPTIAVARFGEARLTRTEADVRNKAFT